MGLDHLTFTCGDHKIERIIKDYIIARELYGVLSITNWTVKVVSERSQKIMPGFVYESHGNQKIMMLRRDTGEYVEVDPDKFAKAVEDFSAKASVVIKALQLIHSNLSWFATHSRDRFPNAVELFNQSDMTLEIAKLLERKTIEQLQEICDFSQPQATGVVWRALHRIEDGQTVREAFSDIP